MARTSAVFVDKRIVARDAVVQLSHAAAAADAVARVDVNAQHFCQQRRGALPAAKRIATRATVAEADVKIPIRAEADLSALVVAERLWHFEHDALGFQIRLVRVGGGNFEFADDAAERKIQRLRVLVSGVFLVVIDVEKLVGLEAGMERNAQKAVFIVEIRLAILDVEKLLRVATVRTFLDD